MRNLSRAVLAAAPLGAALAACGSSSTPTTTPTSVTSVTTAATLSTRQITGPVLNVTQLGFRMTFPAQLGTVNYQIDGSGGGKVATYNGISARFVGTVDLFTSLYASQCAPATSTTTSSTGTGTTTAVVPLTTPAATPAGSQNPVEAQILVWDNTNASSLAVGPGGGPDAWVRAGAKLLGFRNAPGFSGCGTNQLTLDLPLLREMFLTARAD